jgi:opacity protein-like surface antigen
MYLVDDVRNSIELLNLKWRMRVMKKIIIAAVALGFLFTGAAWAQVTPNLDQGTSQLGINGSWDNNSALGYQFNFGGSYYYSLSDNFQLGGVLGWQSNDLSDTFLGGVEGVYNITTGSAWVPFLTLGALYAGVEVDDDVYNNTNEADKDAWVGRLGGGVKYFLTNDVALSLSLNYDLASKDIYPDEDGNVDDYNISMLLGLQFYFN